MDCSLPVSSAHGILQARILEWAAISFSRGSSLPDPGIGTQVFCIASRFFTVWATRGIIIRAHIIGLTTTVLEHVCPWSAANFSPVVLCPPLLSSCPPRITVLLWHLPPATGRKSCHSCFPLGVSQQVWHGNREESTAGWRCSNPLSPEHWFFDPAPPLFKI